MSDLDPAKKKRARRNARAKIYDFALWCSPMILLYCFSLSRGAKISVYGCRLWFCSVILPAILLHDFLYDFRSMISICAFCATTSAYDFYDMILLYDSLNDFDLRFRPIALSYELVLWFGYTILLYDFALWFFSIIFALWVSPMILLYGLFYCAMICPTILR